jgi:hypothetical protein
MWNDALSFNAASLPSTLRRTAERLSKKSLKKNLNKNLEKDFVISKNVILLLVDSEWQKKDLDKVISTLL